MKNLEQIVKYVKKIGIVSLLVAELSGFASGGCDKKEEPNLLIESISQHNISKEKFNTDFTAIITDKHDNQYDFSQYYTNPSFINTDFNKRLATIEKDRIFYLCDFAKIKKIERVGGGKVKVYLRNDKQIIGNWVPNDRTSNFYRAQNNLLERGYVYGLSNNGPSKIRIDYIKQIIFKQIKKRRLSETEIQRYSKKIELTDSTIFKTDLGYIVDFCGHHWRSRQHTRMNNHCRVMDNKGYRSISLEDIAEITFIGKSSKLYLQCRDIILKYKDGREQKESLFLTSESYRSEERRVGKECRSRWSPDH